MWYCVIVENMDSLVLCYIRGYGFCRIVLNIVVNIGCYGLVFHLGVCILS